MKFTDQTGYSIELEKVPERVVSLVPSQTELLWDLGIRESLVGITKFCIHPDEMFQSRERVGGTKQIDFGKIRKLNPDMIIANKEENDQGQIEALRKEFPVWVSDIYDVNDALLMIENVGNLMNKVNEAGKIVGDIEKEFQNFKANTPTGKKAAYLIWYKPYMAAASNTFINAMLHEIGFENVFRNISRYPKIKLSDLLNAAPDLIFLSSEPFPFEKKHLEEMQTACPHAKVMLVDGEMFSWYGSRMKKAPEYFNSIFNSV